ncbi:MAG: hypothetical protein HOP29_01490 [Phycisphaerales bacterium]|nr:hypothetical protein [Phycisphaerales bacterium]
MKRLNELPINWVLAASCVVLPAASARAQCTEGCVAIHTWEGEAAGDQHGWVSNNVGDLTGDGINDLVLTAPTNGGNGSNSGRIYVYSGASGAELFRATGPGANWQLGFDAAGAGDLNGDGRPEVIAGAPGGMAGRAVIYTYNGTSASVLQTLNGQAFSDQFGFRVSGGFDVNGDAVSDVVVGAPQNDAAGANAGRAYVYSGSGLALICTLDGPSAGAFFGSSVTMIGDNTGDGRSEILVGAQHAGAGAVGRAYVYSFDGANCNQEYVVAPPPGPALDFGLWFMSGGHDVDGDGVPDFYVNDYAVNRAHVFSGLDGTLIRTLMGDNNGQFGIGRMTPDVNGDCLADFILAAWISNNGAANAGKAFVYSGADGSVLETFTHNVAGAGFGFDANGMGDVDGDGRYDYLITAASDLGNRGRSYLIAGNIDDAFCTNVCCVGESCADLDETACGLAGGTFVGPGKCDNAVCVVGACCEPGLCTDLPGHVCDANGGQHHPGMTCGSEDCNANSILDACDIEQLTSSDVNGNGVPDECECVDVALFGDVNHDMTVDIFDILCLLDGFAGVFADCAFADVDLAPCRGDGSIDIFDILAVLDAFAGGVVCPLCP